MRILIADDSITTARALTGILEGLGHTVVGHAKNGVDAVRLYAELKPDVVLLDLVMPQMGGWLDFLYRKVLRREHAMMRGMTKTVGSP